MMITITPWAPPNFTYESFSASPATGMGLFIFLGWFMKLENVYVCTYIYIYIYIYIYTHTHMTMYVYWPKIWSTAQETRVQSQVESYQRLIKWYLIFPCITLSIIRYQWKALGMGVSIMGVLRFLRNLWFHRVILPDPATLILYWRFGRVSTIRPAMSHRWIFGFWMETASLLQSGDKACAVQLYLLMRSALVWIMFFSRFWTAAIHSGCGLYKCWCDGI